MTTAEKRQELLDRVVSRLVSDNSSTESSKELAAKTTQILKQVREFNAAMSSAAGVELPPSKKNKQAVS